MSAPPRRPDYADLGLAVLSLSLCIIFCAFAALEQDGTEGMWANYFLAGLWLFWACAGWRRFWRQFDRHRAYTRAREEERQ